RFLALHQEERRRANGRSCSILGAFDGNHSHLSAHRPSPLPAETPVRGPVGSRAGLDGLPGSASGGPPSPHQAFPPATSSSRRPRGGLCSTGRRVQMICHSFLANVDTARELRETNGKIRYHRTRQAVLPAASPPLRP